MRKPGRDLEIWILEFSWDLWFGIWDFAIAMLDNPQRLAIVLG
jgi:hypothetical protein